MTTPTRTKLIEVMQKTWNNTLHYSILRNRFRDIADAILEQFPCTHEPKWIAWQSQPGDVYCHTCGKRKELGGE